MALKAIDLKKGVDWYFIKYICRFFYKKSCRGRAPKYPAKYPYEVGMSFFIFISSTSVGSDSYAEFFADADQS